MNRTLGNIIGDSLELCLGYSERLLKDVPAEKFARYAVVNGQVIESNHPAFAFGHLCLYGPRIFSQFGQAGPVAPDEFEAVFSKDAKCMDDPNANIYPAMTAVTKVYFDGYNAALKLLRSLPDSEFQVANPVGGRMTDLFPTLGSLHSFYCGGHMMMHLGQVSAWRRMMGLGAA
jgi:hypothetical protein